MFWDLVKLLGRHEVERAVEKALKRTSADGWREVSDKASEVASAANEKDGKAVASLLVDILFSIK